MFIPHDYVERIYAGVLGKIIGVYLGRPFEGWNYERITAKLGEVNYYLHEKFGVPLIVTDDDLSGTFTFLRALPDYGCCPNLTPAQIGQTWLNYIIERRTILWWGGLGQSTEHTAYLRLKNGITAPHSGSMALNGKVVAEQIGAQIFIDGWAMVSPGDPQQAADLARRAARVSHDGEAIYGAQVIAAMEAQAFVEPDLHKLLDTAVSLIPADSAIYRLITDIRHWHAGDNDWRKTRERIAAHYGYNRYGGGCHLIPNHALIILALLYGEDDFQKSLMIVNTCGWDTDCNSGNVGCVLGIKNGLTGLETGPDWRGPIADRLYLPTADGGRAITDAVTESYHLSNIGRALAGQPLLAPKNGARFHFDLPGAVQGFQPEDIPEGRGVVRLENVAGYSRCGQHSLAIHYHHLAPGRVGRIATPTFIPSAQEAAYFEQRGYPLLASPTLYPGQTVRVGVGAGQDNAQPIGCALYLRYYGLGDQLMLRGGPQIELSPSAYDEFTWQIPDLGGAPIAAIGLELSSNCRADGVIYLDYLTWDGMPSVVFRRPDQAGEMWRQAWVNGVYAYNPWWTEAFRLIQNSGRGLLIQGTREWANYRVSAAITPHLAAATGLAAYVQGMRRYYALLLSAGGYARLVKVLDGETILAEIEFAWELDRAYEISLQIVNSSSDPAGIHLTAGIDGQLLFSVTDSDRPLQGGAIALVCEEGRIATESVTVQPISAL